MPSSYTPSLRLVLPVTGELTGTWGDTVNNGLTSLVDAAIAGTSTVSMTDANTTLTAANETADQARSMFIRLTGTLSATRDVICPAVSKLYFVTNATTGGQSINFKTASGSGITVANGASTALYCNGTNVLTAFSTVNSLTNSGNFTNSGNLTFTGTGNRITGDFSNATVANRVMFQTSTVNGNTVVQALPNGAGQAAYFGTLNNSDANNFSRLLLGITQTQASIESQAQGTGGFLPMTFYTGGSERMRIATDGTTTVGQGITAQFPTTLVVTETGHATSKRASLQLGNNWLVLQDSAGNGTRDLQIYDTAAAAARVSIATNGNTTFAQQVTATQFNGPLNGNAATVTNGVYTTGDQTIAGAKTFTNRPVIATTGESWFLMGSSATAASFGAFYRGATTTMAGYIGTDGGGILGGGTGTGFGIRSEADLLLMSHSALGATLASGGNFTAVGNVTAYSDIRLKTDLTKISNALAKVNQLNGYTYTRIDTGERQTGVVAQEVQSVLPEAVIDGGEHLAVAYGNMVGLLIEAVKELTARVEKLEGR